MATRKNAKAARLGDEKVHAGQPYAEVELRGETYKLCMTFKAMAVATRALRALGLTTNLAAAIGNLDFDNMGPLTAAALATYHPELSFSDTDALTDLDTMGALATGLRKAFAAAYEEVEKRNPPAAAVAAEASGRATAEA